MMESKISLIVSRCSLAAAESYRCDIIVRVVAQVWGVVTVEADKLAFCDVI